MSAFSEYILLSSGYMDSWTLLDVCRSHWSNRGIEMLIVCPFQIVSMGTSDVWQMWKIFKLELFFRLVFGLCTFRSIEKVFFSLKVCLDGRQGEGSRWEGGGDLYSPNLDDLRMWERTWGDQWDNFPLQTSYFQFPQIRRFGGEGFQPSRFVKTYQVSKFIFII